MTKISLYRFLTTFCIVPVNDWSAFIQRVVGRILAAHLVLTLLRFLKTPFWLGAFVVAFTIAPDTIMWIFMAIGNIELRVMAVVLAQLMPDIFNAGAGAYTSWTAMWSAGLSILPEKMLELINGIGVAEILGLVTSTFTAVSSIKIYRKVMLRAGLL